MADKLLTLPDAQMHAPRVLIAPRIFGAIDESEFRARPFFVVDSDMEIVERLAVDWLPTGNCVWHREEDSYLRRVVK